MRLLLAAHWGSELGASDVLVANTKRDCSASSTLRGTVMIEIERLLPYA
jgi:hypothetical protein